MAEILKKIVGYVRNDKPKSHFEINRPVVSSDVLKIKKEVATETVN